MFASACSRCVQLVKMPSCSLTRSHSAMLAESSDFFFQAEDGIRDYKVTGVQTCALPIYQRGGQKRHLAMQQSKARVDVAREGIEEAVDDRYVVHGESSCPGASASAGSSKLGGIGGRAGGGL